MATLPVAKGTRMKKTLVCIFMILGIVGFAGASTISLDARDVVWSANCVAETVTLPFCRQGAGATLAIYRAAAGVYAAIGTGGGGSGDALVANPLSQFAATTSAQLAGVISNETGTGVAVFGTTPTLTTPIIGVATGTSLALSQALIGAGAVTISAAPSTADYSGVRNETWNILGATTAGTPASGYVYIPELTPHFVNFYSSSGHNQSTSTNTGRTALTAYRTNMSSSGQGDLVAYNAAVYVEGAKAGATHWLANPAAVVINGDAIAGAGGVFLNPLEIHLVGGVHDVAAIGGVWDFSRNDGTGALSATWLGLRLQSSGSVAIDSGVVIAGSWKTGFDVTPATLTANKAAIALKADDRIYLNASSTADSAGIKAYATTVGAQYLEYNSAQAEVNLVAPLEVIANRSGYGLYASNAYATASSEVIGVKGQAASTHASGTSTLVVGGNFETIAASGASITSARGFSSVVLNTGTGTIAGASGVYLPGHVNSGGGTIGSAIGMVVDPQTAGGFNVGIYLTQNTDGWPIYSAGTGVIYTGGRIGIGTNAPSGPLVATPPATQTIAAGNTVLDDGCGSVKRITAAGAVTTSTVDTFTAPAAVNGGCEMQVCNVGANTITLDSNANFVSADVALIADACVVVVSSGASGKWYQAGNSMAGGLSGGAANKIAYWTSATALSNDTDLHWDATGNNLGIGIATFGATFHNGIAMAHDGTNFPTTNITDTFQMYARDQAGSTNSSLFVKAEAGGITSIGDRVVVGNGGILLSNGVIIGGLQLDGAGPLVQLSNVASVAHGITGAGVATSTFFDIRPVGTTDGGAQLRGVTELSLGMILSSVTTTDPVSTKTTTSDAAMRFEFGKKFISNPEAMAAGVNLVAFSDAFAGGLGTRWILDNDGDTWQPGTVTATQFFPILTATQTIAAGNTVAADACGGIKRITAAGAVTTDTTNTFTAPAAGNSNCEMTVCNVGTNAITLDNNANFSAGGITGALSGTDVVLGADDCVSVGSTGASGKWFQAGAGSTNG